MTCYSVCRRQKAPYCGVCRHDPEAAATVRWCADVIVSLPFEHTLHQNYASTIHRNGLWQINFQFLPRQAWKFCTALTDWERCLNLSDSRVHAFDVLESLCNRPVKLDHAHRVHAGSNCFAVSQEQVMWSKLAHLTSLVVGRWLTQDHRGLHIMHHGHASDFTS